MATGELTALSVSSGHGATLSLLGFLVELFAAPSHVAFEQLIVSAAEDLQCDGGRNLAAPARQLTNPERDPHKSILLRVVA